MPYNILSYIEITCDSTSTGVPIGYSCLSTINYGSFCSPTCSTGYSGIPFGFLTCDGNSQPWFLFH